MESKTKQHSSIVLDGVLGIDRQGFVWIDCNEDGTDVRVNQVELIAEIDVVQDACLIEVEKRGHVLCSEHHEGVELEHFGSCNDLVLNNDKCNDTITCALTLTVTLLPLVDTTDPSTNASTSSVTQTFVSLGKSGGIQQLAKSREETRLWPFHRTA
jgi:hypothetical protein